MKLGIIGAGNLAGIIAQKARKSNVITYCFAWEKGAVAKSEVDVFFPISIFEKDEIVRICRENEVDGVVATTELTIAVAAYVADKLGYNYIPLSIANVITDKSWVRSRNALAKYFFQPEYYHLNSENELKNLKFNSFPYIVKPVGEGGKRGITVVNNRDELTEACETAFQSDRQERGILIEEFIAGGTEYSVEGLSFHGNHYVVQVTEKISSGPPHCVELGHSQPANIKKEMRRKVTAAICELLDNVGLQNGPSHTEIKIVDNKIFLIELNSRPGGDHIAYPLTELSTGYDYITQIICVALNHEPSPPPEKSIAFAGVRFISTQTKELVNIFNNCDDKPWLYKKHVESETLSEIKNNNGYHTNYFIYRNETMPDF